MTETKYWTWFMAAGVVILVLLGLHMMIMHLGVITHLFVVDKSVEATAVVNSQARDASIFFPLTYVLLLAAALFHGLYGLRTILFELTLKKSTEKALSVLFLVLGVALFCLGTWAAYTAHANALKAPAPQAAVSVGR